MKKMHHGLNLQTSKGMGMFEKSDVIPKNPSGISKTTQRTVNKDKYPMRVSRLPKPVKRAWQDLAPQKDNNTKVCGNDLLTYRRLTSHMGNVTMEIIPIYRTASQIKDGPNCNAPLIKNSDSKYYLRKITPLTSPQINPRDRIRFRCSKFNYMYPAGLKRQGLEQRLPALVKLGPFDINQHIEVHQMHDCASRKIPLTSSLDSENRIQSMINRSNGRVSCCPSGRLHSTRIPLRIFNQRIGDRLISQKIIGKDESLFFTIPLSSPSKFASIMYFFTEIPTLSSSFSGELQFIAPHHKDYNEDSNKKEFIKRESFSSLLMPSTSNSSLNRENEPSKEFINSSSKFYIFSTATSTVNRPLKSFICSTTTGAQNFSRNSAELKLNGANAKPIVDKEARCALGVRDSLDWFYRFKDSLFESSLDSSKSISSKRASHTTIDQIEMELDAKTTDIKPQLFYGRPINRIPSLAVSSYSVPTTLETVRNLEYERHVDTKYINSRNSTPSKHNPSEEKDFFEGLLVSGTVPNNSISQYASQSRLSSNELTSFRIGFPVLTTEFNSSGKKVRHGLSTHYPECISLGNGFSNHEKTQIDSRHNLSPEPASTHLQEDQFCSDLDHDQYLRKKDEIGLNKTELSPIYDQDSTLMLNFSHTFSTSLAPLSYLSFIAPKSISPTRQMFESNAPQLMKTLPPPPPGYTSTEVEKLTRNKHSEISHLSSSECVKSEKNPIRPEIYEKNVPSFLLPTSEDLMKRIELKNNTVYTQKAQGSNQYHVMKRSSAKLNFSTKSLPTLSNSSSESETTSNFALRTKNCLKYVKPASITELKESKGLKCPLQNLKTPNVQNPHHETARLKKVLASLNPINRLLNSRPKVSPASRTKLESKFGYFRDNIRSIREISANNDLNKIKSLFTSETIKRKNLEQSSSSHGPRKKKLKSDLAKNVELTSVNSDNELQVEGHRILKKLSHIRCRIASSLVVTRRKSNDERLWGTRCSPNTGKMHTARSFANPIRKHFISSSIINLKEKLQSQRLGKKFRVFIHGARSSIAFREKFCTKVSGKDIS